MRGIAQRQKQLMLKRMLLHAGVDVLALQETMLSSDERIEKDMKPFLANCEVFVSHAVGKSGGCFLLLKKVLPLPDLNVVTDETGRFILVGFVVHTWDLRIMCVCAPISVHERDRFYSSLMLYLETAANGVLMGDFNTETRTS